jgi:hypothetical protein
MWSLSWTVQIILHALNWRFGSKQTVEMRVASVDGHASQRINRCFVYQSPLPRVTCALGQKCYWPVCCAVHGQCAACRDESTLALLERCTPCCVMSVTAHVCTGRYSSSCCVWADSLFTWPCSCLPDAEHTVGLITAQSGTKRIYPEPMIRAYSVHGSSFEWGHCTTPQLSVRLTSAWRRMSVWNFLFYSVW